MPRPTTDGRDRAAPRAPRTRPAPDTASTTARLRRASALRPGALGVAGLQRAQAGQQHQRPAGGQQEAADHVAGEVPADRDHRERDAERQRRAHHRGRGPQPRRDHQHQRDGQRHRRRGVAAGERRRRHARAVDQLVRARVGQQRLEQLARDAGQRRPAPPPAPPSAGARARARRRPAPATITATCGGSPSCPSQRGQAARPSGRCRPRKPWNAEASSQRASGEP